MGMAIFYPVLAQMALTLALLMGLGLQRRAALAQGAVTLQDVALDTTRWPPRSRQFANCYANQFELPMLFYVLCITAHLMDAAGGVFVGLGWLFVVLRIAHAVEHTTSNVVMRRGAIFAVGFVCLLAMIGVLASHVLLPPGL